MFRHVILSVEPPLAMRTLILPWIDMDGLLVSLEFLFSPERVLPRAARPMTSQVNLANVQSDHV